MTTLKARYDPLNVFRFNRNIPAAPDAQPVETDDHLQQGM
jgi:hypothetical protein